MELMRTFELVGIKKSRNRMNSSSDETAFPRCNRSFIRTLIIARKRISLSFLIQLSLIFLATFLDARGAWAGSSLETPGIIDSNKYSSNDGGDNTLSGPGLIKADNASAMYWVNFSAHTLDTGNNTITVTVTDTGISQNRNASLQTAGTLEVRSEGGIELATSRTLLSATEHGAINNAGTITNNGGMIRINNT